MLQIQGAAFLEGWQRTPAQQAVAAMPTTSRQVKPMATSVSTAVQVQDRAWDLDAGAEDWGAVMGTGMGTGACRPARMPIARATTRWRAPSANWACARRRGRLQRTSAQGARQHRRRLTKTQ